MNYRHIYHAGNFADVFKHSVLILLLQALFKKDKSITYLDTHAGIGIYDLTSDNAQKTSEYKNGIGHLWKLKDQATRPEVVRTYLDIVEDVDRSRAKKIRGESSADPNIAHPSFYPGSPLIAHALLRPQDRMILIEQHPEDFLVLKKEFRLDEKVAVHKLDAYQGMKAFLPPESGRGLVLIDPPYEQQDETKQIITALRVVLTRFFGGVYVIWFPLKEREYVLNFYVGLKELNAKNILIGELEIGKSGREAITNATTSLSGCGIAIINVPWKFETELHELLAYLHHELGDNTKNSRYHIEWLINNTNFSAACRKDKAMGDYQGKEAELSPLGEPGVHTPGEVKKLINATKDFG